VDETRQEILEFPGSVDGPWSRYITPLPPAEDSGEGSVDIFPARRDEMNHIRTDHRPLTPDHSSIGTVRYPRLIPKDEKCAKQLAKRTLTNLYNTRPTWLDLAHQRLDAAVSAAYGWPADLSDDEILSRLLGLNLERTSSTP
jgi:hypothetical protein